MFAYIPYMDPMGYNLHELVRYIYHKPQHSAT